jgi:hypothetical protein
MADSTLILLRTYFVSDLTVKCVVKICLGMIRGLILLIDLLMAFITGMVVQIFVLSQQKGEGDKKKGKVFHDRLFFVKTIVTRETYQI